MYIMTYYDNQHRAKLSSEGTAGILAGFAVGHPVITNRVLNLKCKK